MKLIPLFFICSLFFFSAVLSGSDGVVSDNNRGINAYNRHDFQDAISIFKEAEVDSPENPVLYFNTAAAEFQNGNFEAALELFIKAEQGTESDILDLAAKTPPFSSSCL